MDRVPSEISFISFNFKITGMNLPNLNHYWQIVLGVTGDFSISIYEKILYKEEEFCLVEFAVQASQWLRRVPRTGENFSYTSIESEDEGLVRIDKTEQGWRISAFYQEYQEDTSFSLSEISDAINNYISNLERALPVELRDKVVRLASGNVIYEDSI
jgi:hypothetical protein